MMWKDKHIIKDPDGMLTDTIQPINYWQSNSLTYKTYK